MEQFATEHELKYSGLPQGQGPNSLTEDAFINVNGTKVYLYVESMQADYDPYRTLEKALAIYMTTGRYDDFPSWLFR